MRRIVVPFAQFPNLNLDSFRKYLQYIKNRDTVSIARLTEVAHDFEYFHKFRSCQNRRYMDRESQYFITARKDYDGKYPTTDAVFHLIFRKYKTYRDTLEILQEYPGDVLKSESGIQKVIDIVTSIDIPFTGAYLVPHINKSAASKVEGWLRLFSEIDFDKIENLSTAKETFEFFKSIRGFGDFLAMQFTTELGWMNETRYGGNEFVVPGNGAVRGLNKIGLSPRRHVEFLHWLVQENVLVNEKFLPMTLMDYQNTFCEFDKYTRWLGTFDNQGRERQKRNFSPSATPITKFDVTSKLLSESYYKYG